MPSTTSVEVISKGKINCFIKHLKSNNKLETNFPEHHHVNETVDCNQLIKDYQGASFVKLHNVLTRSVKFGTEAECIMNDLNGASFLDVYMIFDVYQASITMSKADKKKMISVWDVRSKQDLEAAARSCWYRKDFGDLFDGLFIKSNNTNDYDPVEDFCARKFVFNKNLLDSKIYIIELNPKNLDVRFINCDEVLKKAAKEIQEFMGNIFKNDESISLKIIECAMEKYQTGNFLDQIMAAGVLSQLDISDYRKQCERKKFIELMTQITNELGNCVK